MQTTPLARWDIASTYQHMSGIYAEANALTTPPQERFNFLTVAAGDLSRCYRKKLVHLYPIATAQLVAWFLSLAESKFLAPGGVILSHAMSEKYPKDRCGYCGRSPCRCAEEARADHTAAGASSEQLGWTLEVWQHRLNQLYGPANQEGGVPRALNRLFEEIAEVGLILNLADGYNDRLDDIRQKMAREMTDVLAWSFALASLLDVNVEVAMRTVYRNGCPVCKHPACSCRNFERRPRAGVLTHRFMPAEEIHAAIAA